MLNIMHEGISPEDSELCSACGVADGARISIALTNGQGESQMTRQERRDRRNEPGSWRKAAGALVEVAGGGVQLSAAAQERVGAINAATCREWDQRWTEICNDRAIVVDARKALGLQTLPVIDISLATQAALATTLLGCPSGHVEISRVASLARETGAPVVPVAPAEVGEVEELRRQLRANDARHTREMEAKDREIEELRRGRVI